VPPDPDDLDRSASQRPIGGPGADKSSEVEGAARSALARARAAARSRGVRPGVTAANAAKLARRRARIAGEGRYSAAGVDARDPQLFGATLDRIVGERGWSSEVAVGGVVGRWDQVVGAEMAAHVTPEGFEDGVLRLRADSSAWATQVQYLVPTLMRRMAEEVGEGLVERVEVAGPVGPTWRKGQRRVPGPGPRDTYG
jgi:predicted nucleic acid-binding Zn ribbon protein